METVGGSLVIHLGSAVVEAVPGCVTHSCDPSVFRLTACHFHFQELLPTWRSLIGLGLQH